MAFHVKPSDDCESFYCPVLVKLALIPIPTKSNMLIGSMEVGLLEDQSKIEPFLFPQEQKKPVGPIVGAAKMQMTV
jgi:hypothetical protein